MKHSSYLILLIASFLLLSNSCKQNLSSVIAEGNSANGQIKDLNDPTDLQDAATRAYVDNSYKHSIGESYGGGIVFYVYDNGQHGLIAAKADHSTGMQWSYGSYRYTGSTGDGLGAGEMNTALIVAMQMVIYQSFVVNNAAKVCVEYSVTENDITYGDWYLPSLYELRLLFMQKSVVGGFTPLDYWSSTEANINISYYMNFSTGGSNFKTKNSYCAVRTIRSF